MQRSIWNILAVLLLFAGVALLLVYMAIFINPTISINPFPPPVLPPTLVLPTATLTPRVLPATWTATAPGGMVDAAVTLQSSSTALPSSTGFVLPSSTNTATSTSTSTETPTITFTPRPTSTPTRTFTPRPTRTKEPTATKVPPTEQPTEAPPPTEEPTVEPPEATAAP